MVAARAAVSQVTVSHILGGRAENYNEETQRQVTRIAAELGYRPNRAAQIMRVGRSNTIVHLNFSGYSEMASRKSFLMGRLVHEAGYEYQSIDSYWWPEEGAKVIQRILSFQPVGLIVSGSLQTEIDFAPVLSAKVPIVGVDTRIPGSPHVRHDVRRAVFEMASQCLKTGRRPVQILQGRRPLHWTTRSRRDGYLDAIREAGLGRVHECTVGRSSWNGEFPAILWNICKPNSFAPFEAGEGVAEWLIGRGVLPDVLLCANDFYAIGVQGVLMDHGIRTPRDVALAGFDNLSYASRRSVSLTTVAYPAEAICAEAVGLLDAQIRGKRRNGKTSEAEVVLPCAIQWRESLPQNLPSVPDQKPEDAGGPRRKPGRKASLAALSLVECLIGIAIISILAALLFPIMGNMRERGQVAGCLNNLRQIGMAMQMYANDHDGWLVQNEAQKPGESKPLMWPYRIAQYLEVKDFAQTYQNAEMARRSPFTCPAEKDYSAGGKPWIHYALTRHLNDRLMGAKSEIRQTAVRSPSKWMVLSDSFASWDVNTDRTSKMAAWNGLTRRHGGQPNFLYADGHAAPFPEEIIGESDPGGQTSFYRSLWQHDYEP